MADQEQEGATIEVQEYSVLIRRLRTIVDITIRDLTELLDQGIPLLAAVTSPEDQNRCLELLMAIQRTLNRLTVINVNLAVAFIAIIGPWVDQLDTGVGHDA